MINQANQSVIEEMGTRELNNSTLGGTGFKQNFTRTAGFTQNTLTSPNSRGVAHSSLLNLSSQESSQINSPSFADAQGISREWIQKANNAMHNEGPPIARRPTPGKPERPRQPPPIESIPKPTRPVFTRSKMYQIVQQHHHRPSEEA